MKILFLSNHFITLFAFRKELINCLVKDHEVYISAPNDEKNTYFENLGCKMIDTPIERHGTNPLKDLKIISDYKKIMKEINPDIIFSYTIKPNIYGAIAANSLQYKQVANITGTGGTFIKPSLTNYISKFLYKISIKNTYKVFFQNKGDLGYFKRNKMIKENYELLPGSGVNLEEHCLIEYPEDKIIRFIFIGRVMGIKGIEQYLECAKHIKGIYPQTEFYIAGFIDDEKYSHIIDEYHNQKIINYLGFQNNISEWIEICHCTILPSIGGEGVPNVLLESAATGRVCIGSNIPGTEQVIDDGVTGYLFEKGNADDLIAKVEKFINLSFEEKKNMGLKGRERMERLFDRQIVIDKYLNEVGLLGEENERI